MMKQFLSMFLLLLSAISAFSQLTLSGKVLDKSTQQALPYVNIGILQSEVGTLSDADGSFLVQLPAKYKGRYLLFSSVGYSRDSVLVSGSIANLKIELEEPADLLKTVEVTAKREKEKVVELGNGRSLLPNAQFHYDDKSAGSAMALLINRKEYPQLSFLRQAKLHIAKNLFPEFKVRLRILTVDSLTHLPADDLVNTAWIKSSSIDKGWLTFDINESVEIKAEQFFLVFEWIMDSEDRAFVTKVYDDYFRDFPEKVSYDTTMVDGIPVAMPKISKVLAGVFFGVSKSGADLKKEVCYYRANSFGEWKRSSGILSAKIQLANFPATSSKTSTAASAVSTVGSVEEWARVFGEKYQPAGFQLSIGKGSQLHFSKGYGLANTATDQKVNPKTRSRIASVSKTLTAAAIMQLYQQQKLALDTPIQAYMPEFPVKGPITVRQLLSHTAGIRHYYGQSWEEIFIQEDFPTSKEALVLFQNDSLVAQAGSAFHYSSFGYILLGAIIENISGQTYLEYMQQNLWQSLHMQNTYGEVVDSLMPQLSKFYYPSGEEAKPYNLSYSYPTGGLISTTDDLVKFGLAILNHQFLDSATTNTIFQQQQLTTGETTGYGLGWYIAKDKHGQQLWFHTGELPSSSSLLLLLPEKNIVVALLTNQPVIETSGDAFFKDVQRLIDLLE